MLLRDRRSRRFFARPALATGFALALMAQSVSPAAAAVGDLDDTFDGNGKLLMDLTTGDDYFWDVAIQPADQKIVAVGRREPSDADWVIVRLNTDGSPDGTFGGGDGIAITEFSTGEDYATAVAIQDDGKIVAVGIAGGAGGKFGIARYETNGTLDSTFSGDGRNTADFTPGLDFAWDVLIQSDDKIVVVGRAGGSDPRFALARYNTNGTLDSTFSGDGKATANITTLEDNGIAADLDSGEGIVVAGYAGGLGGQIGVAKFLPNGTLDTGFSGDGKLTKNYTTGLDVAWGVAVEPVTDKVILGGRIGSTNAKFIAIRLTDVGAMDTTFSGNGDLQIDITSFEDHVFDLALQSDGKVLLAGTADNEFFAVTRITDTGTVDESFAHGGTMIVSFTAGYDIATGIALEADGDVVVVGSSSGAGGRMSVMRLLGT